MSAICGEVCLDDEPAGDQRIRWMLSHLQRSGPDRQRSWAGGVAAFGHALLTTTPEAAIEIQPWRHPDSGCVVVTDSRLDNRPELLLALGIEAPADLVGDCELLHAAWQKWGATCADRLRGDYVFAIWQPIERSLFIARDPMGVRPLYYHHAPGRRFVFGSSSRALLAHDQIAHNLDEGRLADALLLETEGIDHVSTFHKTIKRLPPAHTLTLRRGTIVLSRYWEPLQDAPGPLPRSEDEWVEAQREHLARAVQRRLRSGHRVGSMLSGGLDSSSVAALASRLTASHEARCFPVFSATNLSDPLCVESNAIQGVRSALPCQPHAIDLAEVPGSAPALLDWWRQLEEPFDGSMVIAASVYRLASDAGVRSLLDGVPADNLFSTSGYDRALMASGRPLEGWQAKHRHLLTRGGTQFPRLAAMTTWLAALTPTRALDLRARFRERGELVRLASLSFIDPAFAKRADLHQRFHRYRQAIAKHHRFSPDARAQSSLDTPYITAGIERYCRVARHVGIEPRLPFADRDLIAFQAWVPSALRAQGHVHKWLLRKAMDGILPAIATWRTSKEHLGRQYQLELSRQLKLEMPAPDTWPLVLDMLDRTKLPASALAAWQWSLDQGLLAPVRLALWLQHLRNLRHSP